MSGGLVHSTSPELSPKEFKFMRHKDHSCSWGLRFRLNILHVAGPPRARLCCHLGLGFPTVNGGGGAWAVWSLRPQVL